MKQQDVAVVGEIYVDHVMTGFANWPQPGEEAFTKEYMQEVGGGAAITACALSRLGRSVRLIGAVGAEDMPWLSSRLSAFGTSVEGLRAGKGRTGVTVSVSDSSDRSFFTYVGENSNLESQLMAETLSEELTRHTHVHFAMPLAIRIADKLFPKLHDAGCTISLDVGHRVDWLQHPENLRTCATVDFLLPNEREAEIIAGGDAEAYLTYTAQHHWPSGIVKLGAQGAATWLNGSMLRVDSPDVTVIDTTGAGDAFNAGFIDGLLDKATPEECLRRGCISGSMSTRYAGALNGLCNREELRKCYEESYG
jgi:sugar/nucleoside kinase (ribokinase family)